MRGKPRRIFVGNSDEQIREELIKFLIEYDFVLKNIGERLGVSLEWVRTLTVKHNLSNFVKEGKGLVKSLRRHNQRERLMTVLQESNYDRRVAADKVGMKYRSFIATCCTLGMGDMLKNKRKGKNEQTKSKID